MSKIQRLSTSLINKIAAGEVIERPASVVKELLENAIDAGATRIDVAIENGGTELIRVADDGCGIDPEDLPLAVASHATSKIAEADDLFRVRTLGFRGEALASICEVSRALVVSRTADRGAGAELEVVAGVAGSVSPRGCPAGTTIEVRNLFFNTPVRRKFLRSTQTELGHISETFTRLALACPSLHLTLRHNGRVIHDLPPCPGGTERIARLFGDDLASQLIEVESVDGEVRLSGYVAHPSQSRGNQKMQYLALNGRPIRDRSLQHALSEAYRGLLLTGRYPISFLTFQMPADLIDVNVHPTKLEVRFQDAGRLYSQLLATVRTRFLTTDLTTPLVAPGVTAGETSDPVASPDRARAFQARDQLVEWARAQMAGWQGSAERSESAGDLLSRDPARAFPGSAPAGRTPLEVHRLDRSWTAPAGSIEEEDEPAGYVDPAAGGSHRPGSPWDSAATIGPGQASPTNPQRQLPAGEAGRPLAAMQIHNRYLIAESDEGVVVIDQHALHERILYEQLSEKLAHGDLETQQLLVPEPVDLSGPEAALVIEHRDLLERLGVRVEPFGGGTVLITGYPAMLAHVSPTEILRDLLEQLSAGGPAPDRPKVLERMLHTCACKGAVKAGDPLTPAEITALIDQRYRFRNTHHCPHGRPTELVFTRDDLDKQFKRT